MIHTVLLVLILSFSQALWANQCANLFPSSRRLQASQFVQSLLSRQNELFEGSLRKRGYQSFADLQSKIRSSTHAGIKEALKVFDGDDLAFTMIAPSGVREEIAKKGFLNSHSTDLSRGYSGNRGRNAVEATYTGMNYAQYSKTPQSAKPKYGYLAPRLTGSLKDNHLSHFGDDIFTFRKDSVWDQTTFTIGDSLDTIGARQEYSRQYENQNPSLDWEKGYVYPAAGPYEVFTPVKNLDLLALFSDFSHAKWFALEPQGLKAEDGRHRVLSDFNLPTKFYNSRYVELQFWDKLDLSHVETFTFTRVPPSGKFLAALKKYGVKIYDARNPYQNMNVFAKAKIKVWDETSETGIYFEPADGPFADKGYWIDPANANAAPTDVKLKAGGSTGGRWIKDSKGVQWFEKHDVPHAELQPSAEVISSRIYLAFGFETPETHKLFRNGKSFSISRDIGERSQDSNLSELKENHQLILRAVAAYLKDWDRVFNPSNNRRVKGRTILIDFGGTLGSRARGDFKDGPVFSEAIGAFDAGADKDIYRSFRPELPEKHPWLRVSKGHYNEWADTFMKRLTDGVLFDIVQAAQYSDPKDAKYMFETLRQRRDNLIAELRQMAL